MLKINPKLVNKSWKPFVLQKKVKLEIKKINTKLKNIKYTPSDSKVFRFLNIDLNKVKYIIVGMDPYPGTYINKNGKVKNIANGRSFEPANYDSWLDKTKNSSINNILKAIYINETGIKNIGIESIRKQIKGGSFYILPPHELFDYLEEQGILFINYSLTVTKGYTKNNSGSHIKYWKNFSKMLIEYIDNNFTVEWVLLGEHAKGLKKYITNNPTIEDVHPRKIEFYTNNKCLKKIKNIDYTGKGAK